MVLETLIRENPPQSLMPSTLIMARDKDSTKSLTSRADQLMALDKDSTKDFNICTEDSTVARHPALHGSLAYTPSSITCLYMWNLGVITVIISGCERGHRACMLSEHCALRVWNLWEVWMEGWWCFCWLVSKEREPDDSLDCTLQKTDRWTKHLQQRQMWILVESIL